MTMSDDDKYVVDERAVELSDDKYEELEQDAVRHLVNRYETGALVSEADYLAGVMVALLSITGRENDDTLHFGAHWVFMIMGDRSVVAKAYSDTGNKRKSKAAQKKTSKDVRTRKYADDLVSFLHTVRHNCKPGVAIHPETFEFLRMEAEVLLENLNMWPPDEMED
jgi:hypothetical protein